MSQWTERLEDVQLLFGLDEAACVELICQASFAAKQVRRHGTARTIWRVGESEQLLLNERLLLLLLKLQLLLKLLALEKRLLLLLLLWLE